MLAAEDGGGAYDAFVRRPSGQAYVYLDLLTGMPVLNVHVGTLRLTGRELPAEALRRLIEGDLYQPYPLARIEGNLQRLVGSEIRLVQGETAARFIVVAAKRISAQELVAIQDSPGEMSGLLDGVPRPDGSLLLHICSGRQPGEPDEPFPGRYLLLLEH